MKLIRLLMVVAFFGISASLALADSLDPLVGIKSGGGSTPITVTNPNPSFTVTTVQDPGDGSVCTTPGGTCAIAVFQNQLGVTLTNLTIFIPTVTIGTSNLVFSCNNSQNTIFANCLASAVLGGTDLFFSGGTGVAPAVFGCVPDGDLDDALCPLGYADSDDMGFIGGEFAVDVEGILTNGVSDLPVGTAITTQAITTPEPGSALMLLFGVLALGLTKVTRRAF